jgi:hypothetical protein
LKTASLLLGLFLCALSAQAPARKKLLIVGEEKGYRHEAVSHAMATIERLGTVTGLWDTSSESTLKRSRKRNWSTTRRTSPISTHPVNPAQISLRVRYRNMRRSPGPDRAARSLAAAADAFSFQALNFFIQCCRVATGLTRSIFSTTQVTRLTVL